MADWARPLVVLAGAGYLVWVNLTKSLRTVPVALVIYVFVVLVLRFSGSGITWWRALAMGLVVTPLALWMAWLRRRFTERAIEFGRRRARPWPEERRR
ncbi:hypothetical protein B1R27_00580 [Streptomyces sp. GKU 895]|nr:hypothetical protein B1R27_00580 [Streptomyces sp. GKU 895]